MFMKHLNTNNAHARTRRNFHRGTRLCSQTHSTNRLGSGRVKHFFTVITTKKFYIILFPLQVSSLVPFSFVPVLVFSIKLSFNPEKRYIVQAHNYTHTNLARGITSFHAHRTRASACYTHACYAKFFLWPIHENLTLY